MRKPNGEVWQTDFWQAGMGLVDFTNPAAREWFKDKVKGVAESGSGRHQDRFRRAYPARRRLV